MEKGLLRSQRPEAQKLEKKCNVRENFERIQKYSNTQRFFLLLSEENDAEVDHFLPLDPQEGRMDVCEASLFLLQVRRRPSL